MYRYQPGKLLPGLAIQRLMEKGYGFGGEGDWKTAAMVRVMKIMTQGMKDAKGTSFMEDYTYMETSVSFKVALPCGFVSPVSKSRF